MHVCRPAIVGITDHYIHHRCSPEHYEEWRQHLKDYVMSCEANEHQMKAHSNCNSNRISFESITGGISEVLIMPGKDWR